MSMAATLLALAVLGAEEPTRPPGVSYEVRVVEMRGLDWRGQVHERLSPVTRQAGTTVWTAPREVLEEILAKADRTVAPPRVQAFANEPTSIQTGCRRAYVAELHRVADGPVGQASAIAYRPEIEQADDGVAIELTGRAIDQGVLARVDIEESRLVTVGTYTIREKLRADGRDGAGIGATVQVPEIIRTSVGGEWLIPADGVLVVGLGVHTSADEHGQALACERLALIEARPIGVEGTREPAEGLPPLPIAPSTLTSDGARNQTVACLVAPPASPTLAASYSPAIAPVAANVLPTPEPPARALPTPINHLGEVVPLPTFSEPPPTQDESAEPRPAPQMSLQANSAGRRVDPAGPTLDEAQAVGLEMASRDAGIDPELSRTSMGRIQVRLGGGRLSVHGELTIRKPKGEVDATPADEPQDNPHAACVAGKCCGGPSCDHAAESPAETEPQTVRMCPRAGTTAAEAFRGILRAGLWINPTLRPDAPRDEAAVKVSPVWNLSCEQAVAIALENSESVQGVTIGVDGPDRWLTIAPTGTSDAPWKFASSVSSLVRTVRQAHLALAEAQVREWAAETASAMVEMGLARASESGEDLEAVGEQVERFRLERVEATAELMRAERSLRAVIGASPDGDRRIVATGEPAEASDVPTWTTCLAEMDAKNLEIQAHREAFVESGARMLRGLVVRLTTPSGDSNELPALDEFETHSHAFQQVCHAKTHMLARALLEVEAGAKGLETARRLKDATSRRLQVQSASYAAGTIDLEAYLDSMTHWSNAIRTEASLITGYHAALAALEDVRGTLLERERIVLAATPGDAPIAGKSDEGRDGAVVRTSAAGKPLTGRLLLGISPVPVSLKVGTGPLYFRIPVGLNGVIEVRSISDRSKHSIGMFW